MRKAFMRFHPTHTNQRTVIFIENISDALTTNGCRCRWRKCLNKISQSFAIKTFFLRFHLPTQTIRIFLPLVLPLLWRRIYPYSNMKSECHCKLEQKQITEFQRCIQKRRKKTSRHTFLLIFNIYVIALICISVGVRQENKFRSSLNFTDTWQIRLQVKSKPQIAL